MKRILHLITFFSFAFIIGTAQPQYFQMSIGPTIVSGSNDIAYSMYQTWDGGYIVCGSTLSYGAGSVDAYLEKFDSLGNPLWSKTYGTANWEATFKLIITNDSGYAFAGGVYPSGQTDADILLIKTDQNGVLQWSKKYGGLLNEGASELESIQQTSDLGYIITGTTKGYDTVISDNIFLIKTDAAGDTLWTRIFTAPAYDQAKSVQQTNDGGYILSGRTTSFVGGGQMDDVLIKTDSMGMITWAKTYGGFEGEEGMSVKQTADSGFIVTGATYSYGSAAGTSDVFVVKTDVNGIVQWSKAYGAVSVEASYSIIQSQDGGYAIVGFTESFLSPSFNASQYRAPQGDDSSNVILLKIDSAGNLQWSKIYGGLLLDEAYGLSQARDGGYLICATTRSFGSDSTDNGYIIHTDVNGDINCYSAPVSLQTTDTIPVTTPVNFTYTYGMGYSNYTLTETPFNMQTNLLCITVGLNENEPTSSSITIFPNPANESCVIAAPDFNNADIIIYDVTGRVILKQKFNKQLQLTTSSFTQGVYFVEIKDLQWRSVKKKIIRIAN